MPVMNFDLEDGKPPVTFTLKESDTVRFMEFMAECNRALNGRAAKQGAALADIAAERKRQVEKKGWDQGHDDEHTGCELSYAAACYAVGHPDPRYWPLDWSFKDGDVRRKLIKAGALIVAEIERLDRAALSAQSKGGAA